MNLSTHVPPVLTNIFLIALISSGLFACITADDTLAWQSATKTQDRLSAGSNNLNSINTEISTLLAGFRDVPPAKLLIIQPPVIPPAPIYETDIALHYGTFTEVNTGSFNFNEAGTGTSPHITVEYLNGINVEFLFNAFSYDLSQLVSYSISISSNNRGIDTPLASEVFTDLEQRSRYAVDASINIGIHSHLLIGTIAYTNNTGLFRKLRWSGSNAQYTANSEVSTRLDIIKVSSRRWQDLLNAAYTLPFTDISSSDYTRYVPTAVPGSWAAQSSYHVYTDDRVVYFAPISLNTDGVGPIGSDGYVSFSVSSQVPAGITYMLDTNTGNTIGVAQFKGGPFQCDLNNPTSAGTGTGFHFDWANITRRKYARFDCQTGVLPPNAL